MSVVMLCIGYASGLPCPWENQYLQAYSPNAPEGEPLGDWTFDLDKAIQFPSPSEAFQCWQQVRDIDPVRPDGKKNRPLTKFSVQIQPLEYARDEARQRGQRGGDQD